MKNRAKNCGKKKGERISPGSRFGQMVSNALGDLIPIGGDQNPLSRTFHPHKTLKSRAQQRIRRRSNKSHHEIEECSQNNQKIKKIKYKL